MALSSWNERCVCHSTKYDSNMTSFESHKIYSGMVCRGKIDIREHLWLNLSTRNWDYSFLIWKQEHPKQKLKFEFSQNLARSSQ